MPGAAAPRLHEGSPGSPRPLPGRLPVHRSPTNPGMSQGTPTGAPTNHSNTQSHSHSHSHSHNQPGAHSHNAGAQGQSAGAYRQSSGGPSTSGGTSGPAPGHPNASLPSASLPNATLPSASLGQLSAMSTGQRGRGAHGASLQPSQASQGRGPAPPGSCRDTKRTGVTPGECRQCGVPVLYLRCTGIRCALVHKGAVVVAQSTSSG